MGSQVILVGLLIGRPVEVNVESHEDGAKLKDVLALAFRVPAEIAVGQVQAEVGRRVTVAGKKWGKKVAPLTLEKKKHLFVLPLFII